MNIEIAAAFARNAPIAYDLESKQFFDSSKVQKVAFFNLKKLIETSSDIGRSFLKQLGDDCDPDDEDWMKLSESLIIKLETFTNPEAVKTIEKIKAAQTLYTESQTQLKSNSPSFLKSDYEFAKKSIAINPETYRFCSFDIKNTLEIALLVLDKWPDGLRSLTEDMRNEKECVLKAVSKKGNCLRVCPPLMKADPDVVFAAACQNSHSLIYAHPSVSEDPEFLLRLLLQNPKAYENIPESPYSDTSFQKEALKTIDDREKLKEFISKYGHPQLRAYLVEKMLTSCVPKEGAAGSINVLEGIEDIASLISITPTLTNLFISQWTPILYNLEQDTLTQANLERLTEENRQRIESFKSHKQLVLESVIVHKQALKDGHKRHAFLEALMTLDKTSYEASLKFDILENCLDPKVPFEELLKRLKLMPVILKLLSDQEISSLGAFNSDDLTTKVIEKLVGKGYLPAADVPLFLEKFQSSRHPTAIFTYLKNQEHHEDVIEIVKSFIQDIIHDTFITHRQESNSYKDLLLSHADTAPILWEEDANIKINANLYAYDSQDWQDLFFAGTDIIGSCQNVTAGADFSKCLMGYVCDGKIRILCIKTHPQGPILARSIMKIMETEEGSPAIFVEKVYPPTAEKYQTALLDLAKLKAKKMGLSDSLFIASPDIHLAGNIKLHSSIQNPGLWEYEDAGVDEHITDGTYTVAAKKVT
jgi:Domain of unknown function (DUF4116)